MGGFSDRHHDNLGPGRRPGWKRQAHRQAPSDEGRGGGGPPQPSQPNGAESPNWPAHGFRLDIDREVPNGHLAGRPPRPQDRQTQDCLRRSTPSGEATMTKASKRPELTEEEQAAEAIRARASEEQPGPDELIDRGELDELVPHAQYLEVRTLGTKMREIREGLGLSLTDVSERSGLTRAVVSRLENGWKLNPTLETLFRYAEALGSDLHLTIDLPADPAAKTTSR